MSFSTGNFGSAMQNEKFTCTFNMPAALVGDATHNLPPGNVRKTFLVDEYPRCPANWMRSEGRVKSYFVPVQEGAGMWLDFNGNLGLDRHVAIVISIQGINPITGMPCEDPQLEQYIDTCPKHKIKFGPDRYCKKCDLKWPKQNYICSTGHPGGSFWIDGFKSAEGIVRQYILTAEKIRGVASNIIGKDRVYAIGLSFFTSKEKKPEPPTQLMRGCSHDLIMGNYNSENSHNTGVVYGQPQFYSPVHTPINWKGPTNSGDCSIITASSVQKGYVCCDSILSSSSADSSSSSNTSNSGYNKSRAKSKGTTKGTTKGMTKLSADIAAVQEQLAQTANDPNLTFVTHHAFELQWEGASGKVLTLSNEFDFINQEILDGMMINNALLNGEGPTYNNDAIGIESMIERLETFRREIAQWIEQYIYLPEAIRQGFVDEDPDSEMKSTFIQESNGTLCI